MSGRKYGCLAVACPHVHHYQYRYMYSYGARTAVGVSTHDPDFERFRFRLRLVVVFGRGVRPERFGFRLIKEPQGCRLEGMGGGMAGQRDGFVQRNGRRICTGSASQSLVFIHSRRLILWLHRRCAQPVCWRRTHRFEHRLVSSTPLSSHFVSCGRNVGSVRLRLRRLRLRRLRAFGPQLGGRRPARGELKVRQDRPPYV